MVRFGTHAQKHSLRHRVTRMFVRACRPAPVMGIYTIGMTAIKGKEAAP